MPAEFAGTPGGGRGSFLGHEPHGPRGPERDRFILSPSQYSLVLYALLIELGRLAEDALEQFNRDGSTLEMIGAEHSPGMEVMSGSLGQGLSQAGGIALARKLKGEGGRTWVFMSDGEFQAGQTWEALQTLAFYKVDRLGIYVDVNGQQCDGRTETVMNIEPLHERAAAFGCRVFRVDGHDAEALAAPAA
ncbi:MAG: transketolase, partial [Planctomycetota bacterium]|nr:transketolase [Planctomycetota bacterium]